MYGAASMLVANRSNSTAYRDISLSLLNIASSSSVFDFGSPSSVLDVASSSSSVPYVASSSSVFNVASSSMPNDASSSIFDDDSTSELNIVSSSMLIACLILTAHRFQMMSSVLHVLSSS